MTDRHTVNTITSDALDALYEQLEASEASESQRQLATARQALASATTRAARAEAALARIAALADEYPAGIDTALIHAALDTPGPAATEATDTPTPLAEAFRDCLDSFTAVLDTHGLHTTHHHARALPHEMRKWQNAAETAEQATAGIHVYLSTGCWHGDHDYCKSMTGLNGAKRPGECKKCAAKCVCGCHEQPDPT